MKTLEEIRKEKEVKVREQLKKEVINQQPRLTKADTNESKPIPAKAAAIGLKPSRLQTEKRKLNYASEQSQVIIF